MRWCLVILSTKFSISNSVSNSVKCEVYFFLMSGGKTLQNTNTLRKITLFFKATHAFPTKRNVAVKTCQHINLYFQKYTLLLQRFSLIEELFRNCKKYHVYSESPHQNISLFFQVISYLNRCFFGCQN